MCMTCMNLQNNGISFPYLLYSIYKLLIVKLISFRKRNCSERNDLNNVIE